MNDAVAVIIGATISACVTLLVVGTQHFLERRRNLRENASNRFSDFHTASHTLAIRIGDMAKCKIGEKTINRKQIRDELADRFNSLISTIQLHDSHDLIEIVFEIDEELVRLTDVAEKQEWTRENWRTERQNLSDLLDVFLVESRKILGVSQLKETRSRRLPLPSSSKNEKDSN